VNQALEGSRGVVIVRSGEEAHSGETPAVRWTWRPRSRTRSRSDCGGFQMSGLFGSGSPESESLSGRYYTLQGINLPGFDIAHCIASLVSSRSSSFLLVFAVAKLLVHLAHSVDCGGLWLEVVRVAGTQVVLLIIFTGFSCPRGLLWKGLQCA
jgi:hypothetical protein